MSEILVIGSVNMDLSVKVERIPEPGETISGSGLVTNPGGKGANQSVACARLGRKTALVGKVGSDDFGREMIRNLNAQGVDTEYIRVEEGYPSGTAMIMVDAKGENCIVISAGANGEISPRDVLDIEPAIAGTKILLLQLEIPLETVGESLRIARKYHVPVVLNPAPAQALPDEFFNELDFLVPNETETKILTGIEVTDDRTARLAAENLLRKGVKTVVITLGEKGAYLATREFQEHIPSIRVDAVDSTAAGDAFIGGFASAQVEGMSMRNSVRFACCVGALAATKFGAQSSLPLLQEVNDIFKPKGV